MRRARHIHQHDKKGHQAHETGDPVIHDALGDGPGADAVQQHHGSSQVQGPGKELVGVGKGCKQAQMDVLPGQPEGLHRGPGVPVEVGVGGEGSLGLAGGPGGVVQIDHLVLGHRQAGVGGAFTPEELIPGDPGGGSGMTDDDEGGPAVRRQRPDCQIEQGGVDHQESGGETLEQSLGLGAGVLEV